MKLRYYLVTINIFLLVLFAFGISRLNAYTLKTEDMAILNGEYKSIEADLRDGKNREELNEEYQCKIIYTTDVEYTKQLYQALSKQDIVFDYTKDGNLYGKIIFEQNTNIFGILKKDLNITIIILCVVCLLFVNLFSYILYRKIVEPFQRLQKFAQDVAVGNLEIPLYMQKDNYFGAFTESFDMMREELKKARENEYKANLSKRELVASLSHDIKTPVSTIKALCEILMIKLHDNENIAKIETINQKTDQIDHLISDMFHATLEELEILKINPDYESSHVIMEMLQDMNHYQLIEFANEIPSCLIVCDKLRLNQAIDNIISNSYKYANTKILVTFSETASELIVKIKDFGTGLENLDLFLVCEKYYRGENAVQKNGSGLGLYLANTFLSGMEGSLVCENDGGFVCTLTLKKAG